MSRWNLSENYVDDGNGRWDTNGFRFGIALDVRNNCPGESPEPDFQPVATQTTSMTFLAKYLVDGTTRLGDEIQDQHAEGCRRSRHHDVGFRQLSTPHIISVLNSPAPVPLTTLRDHRLHRQRRRVLYDLLDRPGKHSTTGSSGGRSRSWTGLAFDPANNVFTGDPAIRMPWFAAANVSDVPRPARPG